MSIFRWVNDGWNNVIWDFPRIKSALTNLFIYHPNSSTLRFLDSNRPIQFQRVYSVIHITLHGSVFLWHEPDGFEIPFADRDDRSSIRIYRSFFFLTRLHRRWSTFYSYCSSCQYSNSWFFAILYHSRKWGNNKHHARMGFQYASSNSSDDNESQQILRDLCWKKSLIKAGFFLGISVA